MEIFDELSFSAQYADGCYWIRLKLCLNRRRAEESLVYSGLGFQCDQHIHLLALYQQGGNIQVD